MSDLIPAFPRAVKVAALTLPLLLAAAAVATHRAAGLLAASIVVAAAVIAVLVALVVVERRRLRDAREHKELRDRALDVVPNAVFVLDLERQGTPNVYVNAAYAALTGYDAREAVADGFDARAIFVGGAPTLPADADRDRARVVVRRRDGTTFPAKVELSAVPRDGGGRLLLGTIEPVTLGERATDREPAPSPEPPRSDGAARGRAAGAFLSWLAHELRSPLNACVMWLDVLALGPQPDKLPKAIEAIKRGLSREAKLVADLSDTAKVAAGGLEMRFERLDLVALIASAADAWQLSAIGKPLKLEQRIELAAAVVNGDAERLLQALNHLVENAISSTPPHGRVEVRVHGDGAACVFEVEDTGPELPDDNAISPFAPLERAPSTAKGRSGLGLGLAVAHHVAVRHGGSLTAASAPSGTRFVLKLPLAEPASEPRVGASQEVPSGP